MDTHLPSGVKRHWTKYHFINVMTHELGHVLGITHLQPKTEQNPEGSEMMASHGFRGCKEKGKKFVCNLMPVDFEAFLAPYDPEDAESLKDYTERKEREWDIQNMILHTQCQWKPNVACP